ncbi:MAG TPA: MBL fold metallo-hydrolase [Chloroflexota bacterium]|nr:MBL fold metallo-hydrolase [Chloroflexota bacterium]
MGDLDTRLAGLSPNRRALLERLIKECSNPTIPKVADSAAPRIARLSLPDEDDTVNCYLIGPPWALVDSGPNTPEAREALLYGLAKHGIGPQQIETIILTHHHYDHSGGLVWLRRLTGARILGHRRTETLLSGARHHQSAYRTFLRDFARSCGWQEELEDAWHRPPKEGIPLDETIACGTALTLGNQNWLILETPGHTGGSICLASPEGDILAGDTVLARLTVTAFYEPQDETSPEPGGLLRYRATLRELTQRTFGHIHPGHGLPFSGLNKMISITLQRHERQADQVVALLPPSGNTVLGITRQAFPRLPRNHLYPALTDMRGTLDLLIEQGRITVHGDNPAIFKSTSG